MADPNRPQAATAFGTEKWKWVPAIADISNPKVTEINATGSLDISCELFSDFDRPTTDQNRAQANARVCDKALPEILGIANEKGGNLNYAVNPQAPTGDDSKKAFETLLEGLEGFLVERPGGDVDTDIATGDFVIVYPATLGRQQIMTVGQNDTSEWGVQQAYGISAPSSGLVAVVAGS